ncbi:sulfite exporter TauE/SafE family protein [Carboxylicivirga sp. RSCT41]|uniref:sulfite exporter TauE/SafE family protein n=1 Tax=Carboxylicivirga agarovorans TaxID=3417570 RepID=UPI003D346C3A
MDILIISLVTFITAILTFFSGFGLGTILAPVFALFFPIDVAIALTGVVHFTNNLFKIALVGRKTNMQVLWRFGVPAILAAFGGAWLLMEMMDLPSLFQYTLFGNEYDISPVKLIIGLLLMVFSVIEVLPSIQRIRFAKDKLIIGGALSGFFGGLTGIQGALRTAFLVRSGLSKEAFIATGVVIACLVDLTRLSVYASRFSAAHLHENTTLLISATLAAIGGALLGKKLLKKVTMRTIQLLVSVFLTLISTALIFGWV